MELDVGSGMDPSLNLWWENYPFMYLLTTEKKEKEEDEAEEEEKKEREN